MLHAGLYQLTCSPDPENDRRYLPNLPVNADGESVYAVRNDLEDSSGNFVYIFPIPDSSLTDCSGMVSAVRYCYIYGNSEVDFDNERSIFTLFLLEQQNGPNFVVTEVFNISSTPTDRICGSGTSSSSQYCCDTMQLDPFPLPEANFAYGIAGEHILRYSNVNYIHHFRVWDSSMTQPVVGKVYPFREWDRRMDRSLRLLQFDVMGKHLAAS